MKVGDTIWRFDQNWRVYQKLTPEQKASGKLWPSSGPIYREHWRPAVIVGESLRSWLVGVEIGGRSIWKAPKRGPHPGFAFAEQEIDDACWAKDYRHKIILALERVEPAVLRQVAALIGWQEPKV